MKPWQQKLQNVRSAIEQKGLNYTQVGKIIGVSRQHARNIFVSGQCPSLELWLILENAFLKDVISEGVKSENEKPKTSDPQNQKIIGCLKTLENFMNMMGKTNETRYQQCVELINELQN